VKFRVCVPARPLWPVLLAAIVTLGAGSGFAQSLTGLKVAHSVSKTTATSVEVTGTVSNETRAEAAEVTVTVQALGADGKPVARGISYVTSRLPAGGTANFVAKVPVVAGVSSYRATVSARFMSSVESP
jgi:hypothetical protein